MQQLESVKRILDRSLTILCVALFGILVIVVTWHVFARQILQEPSQWSETLSRYLFVWVGLLGAALVFGERGHIAIDVGVRRLPRALQKWTGILVQFIIIAFSGYLLVWGGWRAAMNAWRQNLSGLPTTVGPWFLVLPVAGVLVILYALFHLTKIVKDLESPFGGEDLEAIEVLETHASEVLHEDVPLAEDEGPLPDDVEEPGTAPSEGDDKEKE